MEETLFLILVDRCLNGTATPAEQLLVDEYCRRLEQDKSKVLSEEQQRALKEIMFNKIRKDINELVPDTRPAEGRKIYRWMGYVAAASILIALSYSFYFNREIVETSKPALAKVLSGKDDVAPGQSKAVLTLADGSRINLDDAKNGMIAHQAGISITKSENGTLVYDSSEPELSRSQKMLFNKIETPNGGEFQISLPDGSKVWLNAASSLRYPTAFQGNERKVELTGEAYFEIAHNQSMPFRIETGNQIVEVLGTHFNINGYGDESDIKTTLIEGSVKIASTSTQHEQFLKPGQVALTTKNGNISIEKANTDQAISWKKGVFVFNDMELENILHQIERWYNVEVDYSEVPKIRYNAHISRSLHLSKVLESLEFTGDVKFEIDGKKVKILTNKIKYR